MHKSSPSYYKRSILVHFVQPFHHEWEWLDLNIRHQSNKSTGKLACRTVCPHCLIACPSKCLFREQNTQAISTSQVCCRMGKSVTGTLRARMWGSNWFYYVHSVAYNKETVLFLKNRFFHRERNSEILLSKTIMQKNCSYFYPWKGFNICLYATIFYKRI